MINSIVQGLVYDTKSEIKEIPFVDIITDETTDIKSKCQLSSGLCYADKTREIQEQFIDFMDSSNNRTTNMFVHQVFNNLKAYLCKNKCIA